MKHHYLSDGKPEHYAVNKNTNTKKILVQLGDNQGERIRLCLTIDQAEHFKAMLDKNILDILVALGSEAGTETGLLIKNAIRVVDPTFVSLSATPAKLKPLKALGSAKLPKIQDSK